MNTIHPEYLRVYRNLLEEELYNQRRLRPLGQAFSLRKLPSGLSSGCSLLVPAVIGLVLLGSIVVGIRLGSTLAVSGKQEGIYKKQGLFEDKKAMEKRDAELDLIKHILSGVVESMKELSQQRSVEAASHPVGTFPRPITVVVKKAIIRELPNVNSKKKALLKKGTGLLALDEKEDWLQVISPFGDDAWIRKDLVLFEDEK